MERIYTKSTRNGDPYYTSHCGISPETVASLLEDLGCSDIESIDETTYKDYIDTLKAQQKIDESLLNKEISDVSKIANDPSKSTSERFDAISKILGIK